MLAADAVILYQEGIVLIRRMNPPYQNCYALPGGFVEIGETIEEAATREAREETGLEIDLLGMVGVYSIPIATPEVTWSLLPFLLEAGARLYSARTLSQLRLFQYKSFPSLPLTMSRSLRMPLSWRSTWGYVHQIKVE